MRLAYRLFGVGFGGVYCWYTAGFILFRVGLTLFGGGLTSRLMSFLPSFLPSFVPSFLPSFLRSFLPSFLPSFPTYKKTGRKKKQNRTGKKSLRKSPSLFWCGIRGSSAGFKFPTARLLKVSDILSPTIFIRLDVGTRQPQGGCIAATSAVRNLELGGWLIERKGDLGIQWRPGLGSAGSGCKML